ncbi:DNA cytosine methyltransferase [Zavarzinella formosa]|uniref:DNA cytosine methyltransferase n=1 Tax=Zavarzinella formosa TaxID=360055 RepID=UPI00031B3EBB|nr:DNA cytosine methyltransferase [Zavarzinella formosa]
MKYISICSGVEAATVAFHPLGWTPLAFSEIEPFPCAVLAHHYPYVPNLGDMTQFLEWPEEILAECDLLVGGPPCQAFSVAGQRNSLDDERGNLTLTYVHLINHIDAIRRKHGRDPILALYENVPGIYSTRDNAFGCLVGALCGQDAPVETETGKWPTTGVLWGAKRRVGYRTLDAQYFGLAQRRRRCFLLAVPNELVERLGDRADPSEILSVAESLRGDSPPSRKTGKSVTHDVAPSLTGSGRGVERTGESRGQDPVVAVNSSLHGERLRPGGIRPDNSAAETFKRTGQHPTVAVCPTLRARGNRTGGDRPPGTDVDTADSLIVSAGPDDVATTLRARDQSRGVDSYCSDTLVTHSLRADGFDASEDGTGRGTPLVPYTLAIRGRGDSHHLEYRQDGLANALLTPNGGRAGIGVGAVAFAQNSRDEVRYINGDGQLVGALAAEAGMKQQSYIQQVMSVRRITVTEAERLMGVPDGYTDVPYRGKPAADGPRYRGLGNSMAINCMAWLGYRINKVFNTP